MTQRFKILIGYDGGAHSDAALDDLKWAGLPAETDALIVSVGDAPYIQPLASHRLIEKMFVGERVTSIVEHANEQAFEALAETRALANRARDRLSTALPDWKVRALAVGGQPAEELLRHAREWQADLIMVGSHGYSALGRFLLGSVSLQVAREATCSVRVGRGGGLAGDGARNLVGWDNSANGDRALRTVFAREWPRQTKIHIVSVDRTGDGRGADSSTTPIKHWSVAGDIDISATTCVEGLEQTLVDEAERWNADCVFLGWSEALLSTQGIFSSNLVTNTECSVEIVRSPRK